MDSLSKIAMTSAFYQQIAIQILKGLIQRFSAHQEMYDHWKDAFKGILSSIVNIQARFAIHRHHLRQEENNFFNRLALRNKKKPEQIDPSGGRMTDQEYQAVRTNERLVVNLLEHITNLQNQLLCAELKVQLVDTHTGIQKGLKLDCKATRYLIKMFANNVDALVNDRLQSNPHGYQQIAMPYIAELQQINSSPSAP